MHKEILLKGKRREKGSTGRFEGTWWLSKDIGCHLSYQKHHNVPALDKWVPNPKVLSSQQDQVWTGGLTERLSAVGKILQMLAIDPSAVCTIVSGCKGNMEALGWVYLGHFCRSVFWDSHVFIWSVYFCDFSCPHFGSWSACKVQLVSFFILSPVFHDVIVFSFCGSCHLDV